MQQYLKIRLKSKYTKIAALVLIIYSLLACFNTHIFTYTAWNKTPDFIEANYSGFFSVYASIFITIPIFYIYLQSNRLFFDNTYMIFRFQTRRHYFFDRTLVLLLESFCFVLFLYCLIFLRAILFLQVNHFSANFFQYVKFATLQTLGYFLLALIIIYISHLTNNTFLGFSLSYIFPIYDYVGNTVLGEKYLLFAWRSIFFNPTEFHSYIFTLIYMLLLIILFSCFVYIFLIKKNYLPKKVSP